MVPDFDVERSLRHRRSSDDFIPRGPKPPKPSRPELWKPEDAPRSRRDLGQGPGHLPGQTCPYCEQQLTHLPTGSILHMLTSGLRQFLLSMVTIAFGLLRIIRFVVAWSLCLVGFVGSCCGALGLRIADPDDRQVLRRL